MSFINPKAEIISTTAATNFIHDMEGNYRYFGGRESIPEEDLPDRLEKAQATYLSKLLSHTLSKGVRPWELVDCSANNDPDDIWIGLEWETGFVNRNEYRAVVQYMWQRHHNWAIDAEGIGPHYGEFTFPPVNLTDWIDGNSMFDDVRAWMKDKNIITPRNYDQIDFDGTEYEIDDYDSDDATDGWGCHVNISVPMTREDKQKHRVMTCVVEVLSAIMDDMSYANQNKLFGRDPYGFGISRSSEDFSKWWWEFKLFRTPTSDEEVENIRKVSTKLALLLGDYSTNPQKYFHSKSATNAHHSSYYTFSIRMPTEAELVSYLSGEGELKCSSNAGASLYTQDGLEEAINYFIPTVN